MTRKVKSLKKTISTAEDPEKKESASKKPEESPHFGPEIDNFVLNVESLSRANHQTMKSIVISTKDIAKKFTTLVEEKGVVIKSEDGKTTYKIKPVDADLFRKRSKDLLSSSLAMKRIPEIFFCSLIHQYDAFLGRLLRVAFYMKPETLNASQRQINFSELMSYDSLEAARDGTV